MTTLKECVRRSSEVPASQRLEQAGNWAVWKVLHKRLCFKPYKMRLVQALTQAGEVKRREFCEEMQLKMEEDRFVESLISYKATFHFSGKGSGHSVSIWGAEQPHAKTAPV
jgi:hypothetical protein